MLHLKNSRSKQLPNSEQHDEISALLPQEENHTSILYIHTEYGDLGSHSVATLVTRPTAVLIFK